MFNPTDIIHIFTSSAHIMSNTSLPDIKITPGGFQSSDWFLVLKAVTSLAINLILIIFQTVGAVLKGLLPFLG